MGREEKRKPRDHYEVLGIPRNATLQDIKAAYRKMALKYHPDKNDDPDATSIFLDIQRAYEILSDELMRKKYDNGEEPEEKEAKNMKPMRFRVWRRTGSAE